MIKLLSLTLMFLLNIFLIYFVCRIDLIYFSSLLVIFNIYEYLLVSKTLFAILLETGKSCTKTSLLKALYIILINKNIYISKLIFDSFINCYYNVSVCKQLITYQSNKFAFALVIFSFVLSIPFSTIKEPGTMPPFLVEWPLFTKVA